MREHLTRPCRADRNVRPAIIGLVALFCCSTTFAAGVPKTNTVRVWPPPPEAPRVAYVQSIEQPSDAGARQSRFRRFANWLSGASRGNEKFSKPFGLSVDADDNLCLTDTGANVVSCYDSAKKQWRQWEAAGKVRFSSPVAVVRKGGTIFVADSSLGAVIVFDTEGKLRLQIKEGLERPSGLALHGEHLLVADSQQHCVVKFDLRGKLISKFGKRGASPGEFNFPTHITVDREGFVYVTDSMNARVQVFNAAGEFQSQIGSAGDGPGCFSRPKGVAVDGFGHVYIVDALFGNVQIFDRAGRLLLDFGAPGIDAGEFYLPAGIAIGRDNRIYVADSYNRRVQVFQYVGSK